jgi:hypothetical protein
LSKAVAQAREADCEGGFMTAVPVKRSNSVTGPEIAIRKEIMDFLESRPLKLTHLLSCSGE